MEMICGDALTILCNRFGEESVQCCITSPPYWGLRDYKVEGQLGLEKTPEEYVAKMVEVFREVRRVLKPNGTLWLNLGDSYAGSNKGMGADGTAYGGDKQRTNAGSIGLPVHRSTNPSSSTLTGGKKTQINALRANENVSFHGLKPKDLVGIPWRVAFALQADGWYLRSDIIWHKPNPMPESVTDRPTKSHEYLFLMSKSERYYYDADAIAESLARPEELDRANPAVFGGALKHIEAGKQSRLHSGNEYKRKQRKPAGWDTGDGGHGTIHRDGRAQEIEYTETDNPRRNKRTVWTIATQPYPEAHFATFPEKLVEPCILAGCPVGGVVLDPFAGSGTVLAVAKQLGRQAVGIDLNPAYIAMAQDRLTQEVLPLG